MIRRLKGLIRNDYALNVFTKVFTALVGIVSSAYSTRYLGLQYKGDYSYVVHVANIIVLFLNLGIYQSYSYNYKRMGKEILKKYTDIFFFQFCILSVIALLSIVVSKDILFCLIVLLVPFNILKIQFENIVLIEKIRLRMALTAFNSCMLTICYIALFYFANPNLSYVVFLTVAVDIVTVLVYSINLRVSPKIWQIDFSFLKSVLRFGFLPMLSGLLAMINYSVGIIFLKKMECSPDELSFYALATNIVNYVWFIPDAFKDVLFSKSARKFDKENILFSSQVSLLFVFLCFVGFATTGHFLLRIIYGKDFLNSYGITLLLIIGAFSMSIYKLLGVVLVSQGRRVALFVTLGISALINIVLNLILIPQMGMYGSGIAAVASYTICGLTLLIHFCRLYSIKPTHLIIPSKDYLLLLFQQNKKLNKG